MPARRLTPSVHDASDLPLAIGALLLIGAFAITWAGWGGPDRAAFFAYLAAWFAGLGGVVLATIAAIRAVRRRRFGRAPANLTMEDVLAGVGAATAAIGGLAVLLVRGPGADVGSAIALGLALGGGTAVARMLRRLITERWPYPRRRDVLTWKRSFDAGYSFPPLE